MLQQMDGVIRWCPYPFPGKSGNRRRWLDKDSDPGNRISFTLAYLMGSLDTAVKKKFALPRIYSTIK